MGACTGTLPRRPSPRPRTHHMLCLQVPPQLLAEVFRTEFHGHSPGGGTGRRAQSPAFRPHRSHFLPRRSLPPFLRRSGRQHFRLLAQVKSQRLGGSAPAVSQSEPGWRAAGAEAALAHPPPASRRRTKRRCRVSSALDGHPRVLFPKQTFCSPGYPALSEVRGPRNHPPLRTSNPESSDGTYSKTGALLRCLPALLPEPSA